MLDGNIPNNQASDFGTNPARDIYYLYAKGSPHFVGS
jgi:hypothetical protein